MNEASSELASEISEESSSLDNSAQYYRFKLKKRASVKPRPATCFLPQSVKLEDINLEQLSTSFITEANQTPEKKKTSMGGRPMVPMFGGPLPIAQLKSVLKKRNEDNAQKSSPKPVMDDVSKPEKLDSLKTLKSTRSHTAVRHLSLDSPLKKIENQPSEKKITFEQNIKPTDDQSSPSTKIENDKNSNLSTPKTVSTSLSDRKNMFETSVNVPSQSTPLPYTQTPSTLVQKESNLTPEPLKTLQSETQVIQTIDSLTQSIDTQKDKIGSDKSQSVTDPSELVKKQDIPPKITNSSVSKMAEKISNLCNEPSSIEKKKTFPPDIKTVENKPIIQSENLESKKIKTDRISHNIGSRISKFESQHQSKEKIKSPLITPNVQIKNDQNKAQQEVKQTDKKCYRGQTTTEKSTSSALKNASIFEKRIGIYNQIEKSDQPIKKVVIKLTSKQPDKDSFKRKIALFSASEDSKKKSPPFSLQTNRLIEKEKKEKILYLSNSPSGNVLSKVQNFSKFDDKQTSGSSLETKQKTLKISIKQELTDPSSSLPTDNSPNLDNESLSKPVSTTTDVNENTIKEEDGQSTFKETDSNISKDFII